ncbi:copper chaperone PCu(A)C [Modestobacter altitudinis]|uniref:copper chaperone PCu(A)C n=1 Tax=Modestobacter altitudinis TaxID=2213158 RepID=UPI00110CEFCC|nr:copper chaperone PCu(A)C [Modestobacter altitudinis]
MNRGLRAAATAVLLLSPVALGACSAGQVAQTSEQNRDKVGAMTGVGDLALRAVELPYPTGGVYPQGSSARLLAAVASSAETDDTLVRIEGDQFDSVEVVDPQAVAEPATNSGSLDLAVPAGGILYLGNGTGPSVTLVGLADDLGVGQSVNVTFTFEQAGSVTAQVPVGTSPRDLPRGEPFDFHTEAGVEQQAGG